jgi:hypothetical protein
MASTGPATVVVVERQDGTEPEQRSGTVIVAGSGGRATPGSVAPEAVRHLLALALPPELRDDRFDGS